jgi:hypothetical protein
MKYEKFTLRLGLIRPPKMAGRLFGGSLKLLPTIDFSLQPLISRLPTGGKEK